MHILILPSWYPESSKSIKGVFFRDQAIALQKFGHKVGVISPQLKSLNKIFKLDHIKKLPFFENDNGILTYRIQRYAMLPKIPYGNYWIFKSIAEKILERYIEDNGLPDIIHGHSAIYGGVVAMEIADRLKIPYVITEHNTGFVRKAFAHWQLKIAENSFANADSCIAVSPNLGELISKEMPESNIEWKWIPNVVADRFIVKKTLKKDKSKIRFLNVGLMTEKKGQGDLLIAFKKVIDSGVSAELLIAGDGPLRSNLEKKAESLQIENYVNFLGMVKPEKLPDLYEDVNFMILSSHYETFGVVVAESLMAGVPAIATRCGGPECIIQDGDGVLVARKDPDALAKGILKVIANKDLYDPLQISKNASARFSGHVVAKKLTNVYSDLLKKFYV